MEWAVTAKYKGEIDPTLDRRLDKLVGKPARGKCLGSTERVIAWTFTTLAEAQEAEKKLRRLVRNGKLVSVSPPEDDEAEVKHILQDASNEFAAEFKKNMNIQFGEGVTFDDRLLVLVKNMFDAIAQLPAMPKGECYSLWGEDDGLLGRALVTDTTVMLGVGKAVSDFVPVFDDYLATESKSGLLN